LHALPPGSDLTYMDQLSKQVIELIRSGHISTIDELQAQYFRNTDIDTLAQCARLGGYELHVDWKFEHHTFVYTTICFISAIFVFSFALRGNFLMSLSLAVMEIVELNIVHNSHCLIDKHTKLYFCF
jgi:hypothetical protein